MRKDLCTLGFSLETQTVIQLRKSTFHNLFTVTGSPFLPIVGLSEDPRFPLQVENLAAYI